MFRNLRQYLKFHYPLATEIFRITQESKYYQIPFIILIYTEDKEILIATKVVKNGIVAKDTRPSGSLGVGLSLDPEGRFKVMGSI